MINASTRLRGVEQLIDRKQYFVIHAARQSGKPTYLKDLVQRLNAAGEYYALYWSLEKVQNIVEPERGIQAIVRQLKNKLNSADIPHSPDFAKDADYEDFTGILEVSLTR